MTMLKRTFWTDNLPRTVVGTSLVITMALVLIGTALPQVAKAEPIRRLGQNARSLAMGGTGVSYSNDEMALFVNPAGMGGIKNIWAEFLPISIETSDDAIDLLTNPAGTGTADDPAAYITDNIGKEIHLRAFAYPTMLFNFNDLGATLGFSYFYEAETTFQFRNQATPEINAYFRTDTGTAIGGSWPFIEGKLLVGANLRKFTRNYAETTLSTADLIVLSASGEALDLEAQLTPAVAEAVAKDVGIMYRLESFPKLRGQFGLVVNNMGGTTLDAETGWEIPQEVSLGVSFQPRITGIRTLMAFEYRDATKSLTDDSSNGKRTHIGLELGLVPLDDSTNLITLRGGLNGSGVSYGAEISLWHILSVQYVHYFQEYGEVSGVDPRGRHILQINLFGL